MRKFMTAAVLLSGIWLAAGCGKKEPVLTGGYEYLIGVSLSNVMEPLAEQSCSGDVGQGGNQGDSVKSHFPAMRGGQYGKTDPGYRNTDEMRRRPSDRDP